MPRSPVLALIAVLGLALPVVAQRPLEDAAAFVAFLSTGHQVTPNVTYLTASGVELKLDVYRPRGASGPLPTVLFFHGGGYRITATKEASVLNVVPWLRPLCALVALSALASARAEEFKFDASEFEKKPFELGPVGWGELRHRARAYVFTAWVTVSERSSLGARHSVPSRTYPHSSRTSTRVPSTEAVLRNRSTASARLLRASSGLGAQLITSSGTARAT